MHLLNLNKFLVRITPSFDLSVKKPFVFQLRCISTYYIVTVLLLTWCQVKWYIEYMQQLNGNLLPNKQWSVYNKQVLSIKFSLMNIQLHVHEYRTMDATIHHKCIIIYWVLTYIEAINITVPTTVALTTHACTGNQHSAGHHSVAVSHIHSIYNLQSISVWVKKVWLCKTSSCSENWQVAPQDKPHFPNYYFPT